MSENVVTNPLSRVLLVQNQDKYLTESEVLAFFHPDTEPRMFSTLAQEILAILDTVRVERQGIS